MAIKSTFMLICCAVSLMASAGAASAEEIINIVIKTDRGSLYAELYPERAPVTVTNFVENIKSGLYDGGHFYRAVRTDNDHATDRKSLSLIQGGKNEEKQSRPPIAHESTELSGLSHGEGILSMAREAPGTADTEFFICIGDNSLLDYSESDDEGAVFPGYAAFGKITKGMEIVRRIQAAPTGDRKLSEKEQAWAPDWILPQLLNESVLISNIDIVFENRAQVAPGPIVSAEDYARAERFLRWNADKYVANRDVKPHWIGSGDSFWYLRRTPAGGKEFLRVNSASGEKQLAFDHKFVAAELSRLGITSVTWDQLPFDSFSYNADKAIEFQVTDQHYRCSREACELTALPESTVKPGEVPSPDGRWAVYFREQNLWQRALDGSADFALTSDGVEDNTYGISTGTDLSPITRKRLGIVDAPLVIWSPDSERILTQRIDQSQVEMLYLLQNAPEDGSSRPRLYSYRYAMALDEHKPMAEFVVLDVRQHSLKVIDYPPIPLPFVPQVNPMFQEAWWQADSQSFYFVHRHNFGRGYSIHRADARTGEVSTLVDYSADGTTFPGPSLAMPALVRPLADGGLVWYSDQSGWGHLYYRDPSNSETRQLTSGDWPVLDIVRIDEQAGRVFFIRGKPESEDNPYFRYLASVKLDGTDLQLLTPDEGNHQVEAQSFSPGSEVFVDNYSSIDNPGVSVLRSSDGRVIAELQRADNSALEKSGFIAPEPFQANAADGTTRLWGQLFKPSNFDPEKSYPVVDSIYPGPQAGRVQQGFSEALFDRFGSPQALAELGFIVITVDGRGTPGRSRAFHYDTDSSLLGKAGFLEDHIAVIQQLAETRPWMDLDRVGIYGHSGGGYASTHALLRYPDFFKVAVSSSGNHEQRAYHPAWGESYLGEDDGVNYMAASNPDLAANLKGRLFIIHGALDDNVHPAHSMQLVDALISANKDFDLLILPNANHRFQAEETYYTRRLWDYFVVNLLGATPPANYAISGPG